MGKKNKILRQIANHLANLRHLVPKQTEQTDFAQTPGFVWQAEQHTFLPLATINHIALPLLTAIDNQQQTLLNNTLAFAQNFPANNALLWGARGMGKSSLVKAVFEKIRQEYPDSHLKLVEVHREDLTDLPHILRMMRPEPYRFIVYCDDLSFEREDTSYKSLKALLEGGLEGRPENVIFYATSNRRHLLPRSSLENEHSSALNPSDVIHEKISLSDRFGLWIGFHNCSHEEFQTMVERYGKHFNITLDRDVLLSRAHQWSMGRGARSGRVAWQFIQHLMGELQCKPGTK